MTLEKSQPKAFESITIKLLYRSCQKRVKNVGQDQILVEYQLQRCFKDETMP